MNQRTSEPENEGSRETGNQRTREARKQGIRDPGKQTALTHFVDLHRDLDTGLFNLEAIAISIDQGDLALLIGAAYMRISP